MPRPRPDDKIYHTETPSTAIMRLRNLFPDLSRLLLDARQDDLDKDLTELFVNVSEREDLIMLNYADFKREQARKEAEYGS